jgi:hypothetical protein
MQTCIALGNGKPELLLQVEKLLWSSLFKMANGPCDLDNLLRDLVNTIPWDALAAASESDRQWFALSTNSSQTVASSSHQIASSSSSQQSMFPIPSPAAPAPMAQQPLDMDLSPDFENPVEPSTLSIALAPVSQDSGEQPMDTRLDFEDDLTMNSGAVPELGDESSAECVSLGEEDDYPFEFHDSPNSYPAYNPTSAIPEIYWNMSDDDEQNKEELGVHSEGGSTEGKQDVDAKDVDVDAENVNVGPKDVDMDVDAEDVDAEDVDAEDVDTEDVDAEDVNVDAKDVDAEDDVCAEAMDVHADGHEEGDGLVQPSRTSARLHDPKAEKSSTFPPPKAPGKRQRRPGKKRDKSNISDPEGTAGLERVDETALRRILAVGKSYQTPIDVEALDMLMRNFPIMEEHQVRLAGLVRRRPASSSFEKTGTQKGDFFIRCK